MRNLPNTLFITVAFCTTLSAEITFTKTQLKKEYISEGASVGDIDNDGHPDIIAGPIWWKGPDFKTAHTYSPLKTFPITGPGLTGYSDNFFTFPGKITKDDWIDILKVGVPSSPAQVAINPGEKPLAADNTTHACTHCKAQDNVCNESPQYLQILGKDKQLLAYSHKHITIATPSTDPTQPWTVLNISTKENRFAKYTHGLGAGDINGDKLPDILEKAGWWEQPKDWDKKTPWKFHPYPFAPKQGGAQMFAYDADGDGLNDVVTALNAHAYGLAWYQQIKTPEGKISFKQHIIMPDAPTDPKSGTLSFSQPHAMAIADINGDGIQDIITGKCYFAHNGRDPGANDPAVLYWFQTTRNADGTTTFTPHLIDSDSGVGRQISTADLNGDGKIDIVTSNKKGTHAFIQK